MDIHRTQTTDNTMPSIRLSQNKMKQNKTKQNNNKFGKRNKLFQLQRY
jgi:hypothetical protein